MINCGNLPRIDTPTYQTTLPSTGETINYRPFLVKEQKIIMMLEESQDDNQMIKHGGLSWKFMYIQ